MANTPRRLIDRILVLSSTSKIQTDANTPLLDAALDTRHTCEITLEDNVERQDIRDCEHVDLIDQTVRTRFRRLRLNYREGVTPQILANWFAYYMGSAAAPTGTPADEVQTLTRSGTVSGGFFTITITLEGRTATTTALAYNCTAADIQAAMTADAMKFVQPGDVTVAGDWTAGQAITFPNTGRLGRADIPALTIDNTTAPGGPITGGGTIVVAETTKGVQKFHAFSRSTSTVKPRFSFGLGWKTSPNNIQKFAGFVCESFQPTLTRRQNAGLEVSLIGPYVPIDVPGFSIPACVNFKPLLADDCKILINSNWETTDLSTLTANFNDNVPTDDQSAYGFDDIDVQYLERGDNPSYEITAAVFGSEADALYALAKNERTQTPVDVKIHFGQPGTRFSILAPYTKIKFQQQRLGFVGALNKSTIQIAPTPFRNGATNPIAGEAYLTQATAFLTT